VADDLKTWQEKFAKAADEGSEYLEEHITEITDRLVKNQAEKVGEALNIQLEEKVQSSLKDLKNTIISIVESSKEIVEKENALKTAVRKAGVGIKEKAQAVRTWRQSFDREVTSLVSKSAEDTFEILDHIRDLGLQEIGMRWAWTDGITHKDWAKYHKLKTKFDEWRLDVENVVSGHEGVAKARAASEDVESKAMGTAEEAAKELARLRETGRWKISTGDTSDDWSTKIMPAAAAVAEKIKEKLSEASETIIGTSQGTVDSAASAASSSVADAASSDSPSAESNLDEGAGSDAASALFSALGVSQSTVESASSIVDEASSSVIGTEQGTVTSVISIVSASASSNVDQVSGSIIGTSESSVASEVSSASTDASNVAAEASSSVVEAAEDVSSSIEPTISAVSDSASSLADDAAPTISSANSEASEDASEASSSFDSVSSFTESSAADIVSDATSSDASEASNAASKKVWGGAVAQSVEAKSIVLDDVVEDRDENAFSEKIQSMASEAGDRFADVTRAVSEALHGPTSTGDFVESVTALAAEQYSSAFHAASIALYGTEQGAAESVASVVTSRYADAVSA
jgi:hypothetical protein